MDSRRRHANRSLTFAARKDQLPPVASRERFPLSLRCPTKQGNLVYGRPPARAIGMSRAGYIPDDASYSHQIFPVLNSPVKPGCAETAIVDGILDSMPPIMY